MKGGVTHFMRLSCTPNLRASKEIMFVQLQHYFVSDWHAI